MEGKELTDREVALNFIREGGDAFHPGDLFVLAVFQDKETGCDYIMKFRTFDCKGIELMDYIQTISETSKCLVTALFVMMYEDGGIIGDKLTKPDVVIYFNSLKGGNNERI